MLTPFASCEMSDGTGRVNLRSIGLKGDSLTEAAFTADGLDGWLYKYNPCTEFSLLYYDNLAVLICLKCFLFFVLQYLFASGGTNKRFRNNWA